MKSYKNIIFHHNDDDGIVSASIVIKDLLMNVYNYEDEKRAYTKSDIKTFSIDYTVDLRELVKDYDLSCSTVYFLDYSFSNVKNQEWLLELVDNNVDVIWIDHHKTSIDLCKNDERFDKIHGVRCEYGSGAMLCYIDAKVGLPIRRYDYQNEEIFNKELEQSNPNRFIRLIDDYDRWAKKYEDSNYFHYGCQLPSDPFDDIILNGYLCNRISYDVNPPKTVSDINVDTAINNGKLIMNYQALQDKEFHVGMYSFEFFIKCDKRKYKCLALNRKGNSIMFGNKIDEYDIVCPFYFNGDKWSYSLFTGKDDVNCEQIAKSLGGGGHRKAAGFTSNKLIFHNKQVSVKTRIIMIYYKCVKALRKQRREKL